MSTYTLMYLTRLRKIVTKNNDKDLFPCIEDLVKNGLNPVNFSNEASIPSRQDITQYIASWFKYIGLSADECREWMIEYCIVVLSAISSSSKSQIRHSTKSNIKYIYRSNATFNCGCENNQFKAVCETKCPVYEEMAHRSKENKAPTIDENYGIRSEYRVADAIAPRSHSIKDEYKDQFEKAMTFAQHHLRQRVPKKDVVSLLNDNGFKTRTGKKWSYSILAIELKKRNRDSDIAEA